MTARNVWESFRGFTQTLAAWWLPNDTFCEACELDSIYHPHNANCPFAAGLRQEQEIHREEVSLSTEPN
jgi:hypothetical protein